MHKKIRLIPIILLAVFATGCASLCPQGKTCQPDIVTKSPVIAGPDSLKVGDAARYCFQLDNSTRCGRCNNQGCNQTRIFKWFVQLQDPNVPNRGDIKIVRGEDTECLDVGGTRKGNVILGQTFFLQCETENPECFSSAKKEVTRTIVVK